MRALWPVLLVLFLVPGWAGDKRLPLYTGAAHIIATPVALDPADPRRRRVGALTFLGGVALHGDDPAFGGFSAMAIDGSGLFTLLSDGGGIARFRLARGQVRDASVGDLPGGPGTGWQKRDRDSESMLVEPGTGGVLVGFERANAIWRYGPGLGRVERSVRPPAMRRWDENNGAEAMARMPDGGVVVLAETSRWNEASHAGRSLRAGIRFVGDPTLAPRAGFRFGYRPPAGYDPTDAAALPDGSLLVLNRRVSWRGFASKLVLVDARAIAPGRVARGRELATIAAPLIHDNLEAMAVTREGGATVIWLASDDNQSWFQRSLLLKFRLDR